jgi:hypothetical protein
MDSGLSSGMFFPFSKKVGCQQKKISPGTWRHVVVQIIDD